MVHLCVPKNEALGVCRGFVPDIQVCGTHGRQDLVNVTITSNAEEEEEGTTECCSEGLTVQHHSCNLSRNTAHISYTMSPYRITQCTLSPYRITQCTLSPYRITQCTMSPYRITQRTLSPYRITQRTLSPYRIAQRTLSQPHIKFHPDLMPILQENVLPFSLFCDFM